MPAPTRSAVVTGAGAGIGAAVARALAREGYGVVLADLDPTAASSVAASIVASGGAAVAVACDVRSEAAQAAAFEAARAAWPDAPLAAAVLNAGVIETGDLVDDAGWATPLHVNLTGCLTGVRLAARAARPPPSPPLPVVVVASAGGVFAMPSAPVYAASKGGLVHGVRSLAPGLLAARNVALAAVCPEPVDTAMVRSAFPKSATHAARAARSALMAAYPRLLSPDAVAAAALALLAAPAPTVAGRALVVRVDGRLQWALPARASTLKDARADLGVVAPATDGGGDDAVPPALRAARAAWARAGDPTASRAVVVERLSPDFRAATRVAPRPLPATPPPGHLLVRRAWAGVNASDINFSAGRYARAGAPAAPPFAAGFESVGVVAAVGAGVAGWAPGDAVAELGYGCFSDYGLLPAARALRVRDPTPVAVALLTSGLTAALSLRHALKPAPGDTVLITAAAGGTGQFAVQLAAAAGATVVALVGDDAKAAAARALGAAATVNYRAEPSLAAAFKRVAPRGFDGVWETVGGSTFDACVKALKPGGRVVIVGMIASYAGAWGDPGAPPPPPPPPPARPPAAAMLPESLLWKGATATGFFLLRHAKEFGPALAKLDAASRSGTLRVACDDGGPYVGLASVADAVERLHSGRSKGKVVVQVGASVPPGGERARL